MTVFRIFLVIIFTLIVGYTSKVVAQHGFNLFPVFFGDMAAFTWAGQFNFDFMGFLMLSALWIAWRHRFKAAGIGLGILGFFGGMLFLSAYLFVISFKANGNIKVILLGKDRLNS